MSVEKMMCSVFAGRDVESNQLAICPINDLAPGAKVSRASGYGSLYYRVPLESLNVRY